MVRDIRRKLFDPDAVMATEAKGVDPLKLAQLELTRRAKWRMYKIARARYMRAFVIGDPTGQLEVFGERARRAYRAYTDAHVAVFELTGVTVKANQP